MTGTTHTLQLSILERSFADSQSRLHLQASHWWAKSLTTVSHALDQLVPPPSTMARWHAMATPASLTLSRSPKPRHPFFIDLLGTLWLASDCVELHCSHMRLCTELHQPQNTLSVRPSHGPQYFIRSRSMLWGHFIHLADWCSIGVSSLCSLSNEKIPQQSQNKRNAVGDSQYLPRACDTRNESTFGELTPLFQTIYGTSPPLKVWLDITSLKRKW